MVRSHDADPPTTDSQHRSPRVSPLLARSAGIFHTWRLGFPAEAWSRTKQELGWLLGIYGGY